MLGLACRVLQKIDMDVEYEGHVEAVVYCKSSTGMLNMKAMSRPQEMDVEYERNIETLEEACSAQSALIIRRS